MSVAEQRYVDLKKICQKVDPNMFDTLSWILLLNLDLVPQEDIDGNPNLRFSHELMFGNLTAQGLGSNLDRAQPLILDYQPSL